MDFLSHSTITGFMGGTAVIIILQQLKGFLGLKHFTTKTDVISVIKTLFSHRNEVYTLMWKFLLHVWLIVLIGINKNNLKRIFSCYVSCHYYSNENLIIKEFFVNNFSLPPNITCLNGNGLKWIFFKKIRLLTENNHSH